MKQTTVLKPLKADELTYFCTQLALILKAGVNLNDGLLMLLDDASDDQEVFFVSKIIENIDEGKPLYVALESTGAFSNYFLSMVKIGELTGHLDNVLEGLSGYYERENELKNSLKGAIMHPLILLFMMSAVVAILILKVLPVFAQVFEQLGAQMTATSSAAIEFATSTGAVVLGIVVTFIIIVILLFLISYLPKGRVILLRVLSVFSVFGSIIDKISIYRFSSAMSLMLSSGIETSEALELGEEVVVNKKLASKIARCKVKIANHEPFAQAITEVDIFPSLYSQMIKISYRSGALDIVWSKIAKRYDDEVSDSLNNFVSFIEPLLVGVLSIIIGSILISVLLPLIGIMSSLT